VADVAVLTHPLHRGCGFGGAVVSALCRWGLERGRLMRYAALASNPASLRLARSLGFRDYAVEEELLVG
jgi:predicted GNAT family acetyltransferase